MLRPQVSWSVVVAVATMTMMVVLQPALARLSYTRCDCSTVSCIQKVNTSCSVTKAPTCGGFYVRQLPSDGPASFKTGEAGELNVTRPVTSAGGQTVSLTVMWTEPRGRGHGRPVTQYEVALEGYSDDYGKLGFQSYYVVPSPGQAPEKSESVSVHVTCSCSVVISSLKVFVTSVLGPSEDCDLRQTTAVISLDGTHTDALSITYAPDEAAAAKTPGFQDGSFTFASLSADTFITTAEVMEITCPAPGDMSVNPSTIQPEVRDRKVVQVPHQAICQPYELRVDLSSDLQKILFYMLPNVSIASETSQQGLQAPPPSSSSSSPVASQLSSDRSAVRSSRDPRDAQPTSDASSSATSGTTRQQGLPAPSSSSPSSSAVSKPFTLPLQHAAPSIPTSQFSSDDSDFSRTSGISGHKVGPTSDDSGSLTAEKAQTSSSVNNISHSADVSKSTTDENLRGNLSAITEMNVTTSGTPVSNNQSTGSPALGDNRSETSHNQSTTSPESGDKTIDLIITVAVVGTLVVAACIALFLAIRQLYRRATLKHEFKPVLESSLRHKHSDLEMESPLDYPNSRRTSHSSFLTFTSASKDVLIIYHDDDERHVRNVNVFKHDLARRLGNDVNVRDAVLTDVTHQMLLPPKDGRGPLKLVLVLSAGIRDILTGPHAEELKQFLHEVFQSTPDYYFVILVTRVTMCRDNVRCFKAIFAEEERTFEITDSDCYQFHALTEEILKDGDLTNSERAVVFEPPKFFDGSNSLDVQSHFHKLNEANDNWSEPPRSLFHGMA